MNYFHFHGFHLQRPFRELSIHREFQNDFDVLDRDYEDDDAVRKFTHGERITPFGESRFPEQFLADNTCAGWVLIGRRETSVGPRDRFYWIFLEICRRGAARRDATGRDDSSGKPRFV